MTAPLPIRSEAAVTGNLNTVVAATFTPGATVNMANVKFGTLSAVFTVDAETNTITIEAAWQVSNDGTNWTLLSGAPNNPANVVLATGTSGADAAVTVAIPAPIAVHGYRFCRPGVINRIATGGTVDTYSIANRYVFNSGF